MLPLFSSCLSNHNVKSSWAHILWSCLKDTISLSPFVLSLILSPFLWWSLSCKACVVDISVGIGHTPQTNSLHLHHVWIFKIACCRKTLLSWGVRAVSICGCKKFLDYGLKIYWFRKMSVESSPLRSISSPAMESGLCLQKQTLISTYWEKLKSN
jgi:hypothetical protein